MVAFSKSLRGAVCLGVLAGAALYSLRLAAQDRQSARPAIPSAQQATNAPTTVPANEADRLPQFLVDPFWPKPLPHNWILGQVANVAVDAQDHVWIIQRPRALADREIGAEQRPPISKCCFAAPPIIEFDQSGNVLRTWGGPGTGYDWPSSEHGIHIDRRGFVWIGGNGDKDSQILKFTADGRFVMQIGKSGESTGSADTRNLGRPADIEVDDDAREVYVADGYGNRRVVVFDSETGAYKRSWGAYGKKPIDGPATTYKPSDPPSPQFGNPVHCVQLSRDGLVYVCDRTNNRYQVFRKDGTFVSESVFEKDTLLNGSVSAFVFSRDPGQRLIYMADSVNNEIRIVDRMSARVLGRIGRPGRYAGQFHAVHDIAIDSQGNLYTAEVNTGQRVQKFRRLDQ
jgi:hypothetical protein